MAKMSTTVHGLAWSVPSVRRVQRRPGLLVSVVGVAAFLSRHHAAHAARLQAYRQQLDAAKAEGADPRDLITLDFGVRYETAVLDWFSHLPRDLTAPQPSPTDPR